jgi:hypothetical protein
MAETRFATFSDSMTTTSTTITHVLALLLGATISYFIFTCPDVPTELPPIQDETRDNYSGGKAGEGVGSSANSEQIKGGRGEVGQHKQGKTTNQNQT